MKNNTYMKKAIFSEDFSQYPLFRISPNPIAVQGTEVILTDYSIQVAEKLTSAYVTPHVINNVGVTYNVERAAELKKSVAIIEQANRESFIGPHSKPEFIGPVPPASLGYKKSGHVGKGGCIIDFIGFADDLPEGDFTALNYAKSIAKSEGHRKTFTLNQVAIAIAKRSKEAGDGNFTLPKGASKPSKAQKNILRYNNVKGSTLNPDMVIIITPPKADDPTEYISVSGTGSASNGKDPFGTGNYLRLSSEARKAAEAWSETCSNVHVVQAYRQDISQHDKYPIFRIAANSIVSKHVHDERTEIIHYTPDELFPEYANTHKTCEHDERNRRCADIWAQALDYQFSSPLYKNECKVKNPEFFTKRNGLAQKQVELFEDCKQRAKYIRANNKPDVANQKIKYLFYKIFKGEYSTLTYEETAKPTSSNSKFNLYSRTAPDEEVAEFWDYQAALCKIGVRDKELAPGWQMCPKCGKHPVRLDKTDFDLSIYNDLSYHILQVHAERGIYRYYVITDEELSNLKREHYKFRLAVESGVIVVFTVEEGFEAMIAEHPNDVNNYSCGFAVPRQFERVTTSFSFNENMDSSEDNCEFRTSGDDEAEDLFESIAGADTDLSAFDRVDGSRMALKKYIQYKAECIMRDKGTFKFAEANPTVIVAEKQQLKKIPAIFTTAHVYRTISMVPKTKRASGSVVRRRAK